MTAAEKIMTELARWEAKEIDKFDFYLATKKYPAALVAQVADIPVDVVRDRRRYLAQLTKDVEAAKAKLDARNPHGWPAPI